MSDNVRVTDAELVESLRLAKDATPGPWLAYGFRLCAGKKGIGNVGRLEDRLFIRAARALFPPVARELMALREQQRAADEALTRRGIEATSPRDTLADRIARLAKSLRDEDGAP